MAQTKRYYFDKQLYADHIYMGVKHLENILTKPKLAKVAIADFLADPPVWTHHEHIGAGGGRAASGRPACRPVVRHPWHQVSPVANSVATTLCHGGLAYKCNDRPKGNCRIDFNLLCNEW